MAEQKKNEMHTTIKQLEDNCDELQRDNKKLENEIEKMIRDDEEERQRDKKAHEDQVEYLTALNADYKQELTTLLSTPQK